MGELDKWANVLGLIIGGGTVTAIVQAILHRRKARAEAAKVGAETNVVLLDSYQKQLELLLDQGRELLRDNQELQKKFTAAELENAELKAKAYEQARVIEVLTQDTRVLRNQFTEMRRKQSEQIAQLEEHLIRVEQLAHTKQDAPEAK